MPCVRSLVGGFNTLFSKILGCAGSISLYSKLVKSQDASRGIATKIYSASKYLNNYEKALYCFL